MSKELSKQTKEVAIVTNEKLVEYLNLFQSTSNLTENEQKQFIEIAKMSNLNPFKREIYITAYGQGDKRQCSIIVGYEVYIKRAEMSGLLNGWATGFQPCKSISVNKETGKITEVTDYKATVTIHRKDFEKPFTHEVLFSEYVQKTGYGKVNKFWAEKPQTMLKKVAISQGFRMCFNEVLGGLPYTKEELLDENQTIDVAEKDAVIVENTDYTELLEEAKALLIDCENVDSLQKLWASYPELMEVKEWKAIVNNHKKELQNDNETK